MSWLGHIKLDSLTKLDRAIGSTNLPSGFIIKTFVAPKFGIQIAKIFIESGTPSWIKQQSQKFSFIGGKEKLKNLKKNFL